MKNTYTPMKNTFLTIARARLTPEADTQELLAHLRLFPKITLAHLFSHEPVILLFIATAAIHEFPGLQQRLSAEDGISECTYRHLSAAMRTFFVPTYEPRTWLL
jgi:hypothetical protein